MAGNIEQALRLTVTGNAYLRGRDIGRFWPDDEAFRFCRDVRFLREGDDGAVLVAGDPAAWLRQLPGNCGLRLHCVPRNDGDVPDRMLAGFANGGPRWLVEAVEAEGDAAFWESFWDVVGDPLTPDRDDRIWAVSWWRVPEQFVPPLTPAPPALADAAAEVAQALEAIASFAERAAPEAALPGWGPVFRSALAALKDEAARATDPGPPGFLPGAALGLLHAYRAGWVFGGMGSWSDGAYWGEAEAEGDALSERLFVALQMAVTSAANSSFRPAET